MATVVAMTLLACGSAAPISSVPHPISTTGPTPNAHAKFDEALAALVSHDARGDWSAESCEKVAETFDAAVAMSGTLPVASFDAGLALERCKKNAAAITHFEQALAGDPKLHEAKVRIARLRYEIDGDLGDLDKAIRAIEQAVIDAQFQNVPGLVDLAAFQMKRNNAGDLDAAKANLERALAIDDSYMPAFNQMALYHLTKKNFELAALVATQAIQKNGAYAPIHNTAGLVQIQLGRVNLAVQFFQQAMRLDPSLFEAPMNFARVNLSVRGFEPAEKAFRRALAIRPNDYDAHLGLALALRGQITSDNATQQISAVRTELDACKKIDASRPDAYYNEGILIAEFEAKTSDHPKPALVRAIASFEAFKTRAASKPEYAVTAKSADDRIHDAETTIAFLP
jgi:tetratricopeptide (TPR) repeat protein